LAALTPPRGFRLYEVERDQELIAAIEKRCYEFWHGNVLADVPPEGTVSLDVAKRMRRVPNKIVEIAEYTAAMFDEAKSMLKEAEECESEAKAALLLAMGDAEQGDSPIGTYTYFADKNGKRTLRKKNR